MCVCVCVLISGEKTYCADHREDILVCVLITGKIIYCVLIHKQKLGTREIT